MNKLFKLGTLGAAAIGLLLSAAGAGSGAVASPTVGQMDPGDAAIVGRTVSHFTTDTASQVTVVRTTGAQQKTLHPEVVSPDDAAIAAHPVLIVTVKGGALSVAVYGPPGATQSVRKATGARYAVDVTTGLILWDEETTDNASLADSPSLGAALSYPVPPGS